MNRLEFEVLNIEDQIKVINEKLKGSSITAVCKEIGIPRTTLRDRLYSQGYLYDSTLKQYIFSDEVILSNKNITKSKIIKKNSTFKQERENFIKDSKVENKNRVILSNKNIITLKENSFNQQQESNAPVIFGDNNIISTNMLNDIKELIELKEDLKRLINKNNIEQNVIEVKPMELKVNLFKGKKMKAKFEK